MSAADVANISPTVRPRPVGIVQPAFEQAVRALRALAGLRCDDAERCAAAVPDSPLLARSWKLLLRGLLAIETGKLREAEPCLLQAASLAFIEAAAAGEDPIRKGTQITQAEPNRVAARALHHLGWVYRREERVEEAIRTHAAAYQLRERFGSVEELWETAGELGLDADVARRFDAAERWHREAIALTGACHEEPARKWAIAWTNLTNSYLQAARFQAAADAARSAREAWRTYDPTAVTAAQADMRLGGALLKLGESLVESASVEAMPVLAESTEVLTAAGSALTAFGLRYAPEAGWCNEQLDFAAKLLAQSRQG